MKKTDIRSAGLDELERLSVDLGFEKYRGKQIFEWINKKYATDFEQMTGLPKKMRDKLRESAYISLMRLTEVRESGKDNSKKYLFEIENNTIIENVSMKYSFGNSVCIASQAGCRMGCVFCASSKTGLDRNLTAGEMTAQIYEIAKLLGDRVSNVVIMGSGEPFDNYGNVIKFINLINSHDGIGIGQRHITVSTCGIVPRIYDFAGEGLQANLAISLHAPNDEIRQKLMPIANKYGVDEVIASCKSYSKKTGRRVTYEYAMTEGVNDSKRCALQLGAKLKSSLCHVNLIPINDVRDTGRINNTMLKKSDSKTIEDFAQVLTSFGVTTTIRRSLGSDINASCGQLRNRKLNITKTE